jgi:DNA-binding MarR family transcriptional regulator
MAKSQQFADELYAEAARTCACFNFRKASRVVTQLFDEALQPSGLRSTQLVILIAIQLQRQVGLVALARDLVLDRSTLTRNLQPLIAQGLVAKVGENVRHKLVCLTDAGRKRLKEAVPLWAAAQNRFVSRLGEKRWQTMLADLDASLAAAR